MIFPEIKYCPGTLAEGFETYSRNCLNRVFMGKKVSHFLPYEAPNVNLETDKYFDENRTLISISGVQEKFSVLLEKNKLRLTKEGEKGTHILKPIPSFGKRTDQMPANEHLTMQIARQVFGIETAENALIFFKNGTLAYITKRFDVKEDGTKWAQEDYASLAGRTPQTHGEHYKYKGNYLELFQLMQKHLPSYKIESIKLLKLLIFNYLFSNGDAHFKNFSIIETPMGDYKLSPAYDLLNSRIHVEDNEFALEDGLLPKNLAQGKIINQFKTLADLAEIPGKIFEDLKIQMTTKSELVEKLISASFLSESIKRNYLQAYQGRLKQFLKG
jgi:serine/threonine-protein kinase HipA